MRGALLLALILGSALSAATIIKVVVSDKISYVVDYTKAIPGDYWVFIGNVENTGSVTCPARMKLETPSGKFWTEEVVMDPGDFHLFSLPYITNETEEGNVTIYFCDEVRPVGSYNITPTSLTMAEMDAKASILSDRVMITGTNITAIPIAPKNFVMPITAVNGTAAVEYEYPGEFNGTLRLLVFNSTNYGFIEAKRVHEIPIAEISKMLVYLLIGMIAGRVLNGI